MMTMSLQTMSIIHERLISSVGLNDLPDDFSARRGCEHGAFTAQEGDFDTAQEGDFRHKRETSTAQEGDFHGTRGRLFSGKDDANHWFRWQIENEISAVNSY